MRERRKSAVLTYGHRTNPLGSRSPLRHPRLAQALDLPVERLENARIGGRIDPMRVERLPRRDRPGSYAGRQREVTLQRFAGLRLTTGQAETTGSERAISSRGQSRRNGKASGPAASRRSRTALTKGRTESSRRNSPEDGSGGRSGSKGGWAAPSLVRAISLRSSLEAQSDGQWDMTA